MSRAGAIVVGLAFPVVLAACGGTKQARLPGMVGSPAPAYAAVDLNGDSTSLAALRGQVVLLNVWATWCHPCRDEIPALQRIHEKHAAEGLRVVGVSVDAGDDTGRIGAFAREFGVTYDVWHDPDERVAESFFTLGVPTTVLIDREGTIRWRHTGPVTDTDPRLNEALEAALRPTAAQ